MPLEGVVIATLAGLLAGGRPATACPRLAQNSSTAAVTASEWARTRLRRKKDWHRRHGTIHSEIER